MGLQGNIGKDAQPTTTPSKSPKYYLGEGTVNTSSHSGEGRLECTLKRNSIPASPPTATKQPGTTNSLRIVCGRCEGSPTVLTYPTTTPLVQMTTRHTTDPEGKDGTVEGGVETLNKKRAGEKTLLKRCPSMHPRNIGI